MHKKRVSVFKIVELGVILLFLLSLTGWLLLRFGFTTAPTELPRSDIDAMTVGTDGGLYIAQAENVYALDENNEVLAQVTLPEQEIVQDMVEQDGNLYVSTMQRNLYLIRQETIVATYQLPVSSVAMDCSKEHLYVSCNSGAQNTALLYKFDSDLSLIASTRNTSSLPIMGMKVKPDDSGIFFVDAYFNLFLFDPADANGEIPGFLEGAEKNVYSVDSPPVGLDYDAENGVCYVLTKFDLQAVKEQDGEFTEYMPAHSFAEIAEHLLFDPTSGNVFVSMREFREVYIIDGQSGTQETVFTAFYDIEQMFVSRERDEFILRQSEPEGSSIFAHVYTFRLASLNNRNAIAAGTTATMVLSIVFFVASIPCLIGLLSPQRNLRMRKAIARGLTGVFRARRIFYILIPSMALLILFCYYPIFSSLCYAFMDYRIGFPLRWIGLENFRTIFADSEFWHSVGNMAIFLLADLAKGVIPAFIYAEIIVALRPRATQYWVRMLLFLPGILPGAAGLIIWKSAILNQYGLLNSITALFGMTAKDWLADPSVNRFALILIGFPFIGSYLIFYGALTAVPSSFYEAAKLDGCPYYKRLWMIDLPFVTPQLKYLLITGMIGSVQNVGLLMLTTGGAYGTMTPIYMMYNNINENMYGQASAIALLLFAFLAVVTLLSLRTKTVTFDS